MKILDANISFQEHIASWSQDPPMPKYSPDPPTSDQSPATPNAPSAPVPFKLLLTGKTVSAWLIVPRESEGLCVDGDPPEPVSLPLVVSALHNPLCTFQWDDGKAEANASLFNASVGYNRNLLPVGKFSVYIHAVDSLYAAVYVLSSPCMHAVNSL